MASLYLPNDSELTLWYSNRPDGWGPRLGFYQELGVPLNSSLVDLEQQLCPQAHWYNSDLWL